jgi:hypothetical protein
MFNTKFTKHDDYMTRKETWEDIKHLIPEGVIWESFYGDGESGNHLRDILNREVIHEEKDFFNWTPDHYDIIVSNPPFSKKKEVFTRLKELDKPFIMICPFNLVCYKYFADLFGNDSDMRVVIPKRRIYFIKLENGEYKPLKRPSFDCVYYFYKIPLPLQINYL